MSGDNGDKRRRQIQVEMDKIRRQIENARLQIRGREYVWSRQSAGFKRLKKELDERLRALEAEYTDE